MIRKNFLLGLEKELQCHLPPEMELKIEKNLDILNIKQDKKCHLNVQGDFK